MGAENYPLSLGCSGSHRKGGGLAARQLHPSGNASAVTPPDARTSSPFVVPFKKTRPSTAGNPPLRNFV